MKKSQKRAFAIGAGAAGLAAAAAGIYFLTGKKGAKNRKKVAGWAVKAQTDVVKELKSLKKISRPAYNKAVDTVTKRYKSLKQVDPVELAAMARELKERWDQISKLAQTAAKSKKPASPKKAAGKKKAPARKRK